MTFATRHPSKAAMRRLNSNFRTCDTLKDGYDGYLAYQNAYSFWGTNSNTRPREKKLSDLESVVDGGNYQDHKSGRTAICDHPIMDHVEHWRLENVRRAPFLISHPYLDPEYIYENIKIDPLPSGLDYRVLDPKFDWYIPGVTSLVFVGRPDVLDSLVYEWQSLSSIGSAKTTRFEDYTDESVEHAKQVIIDTLFEQVKAGKANKFGGVGEVILKGAVLSEVDTSFMGVDPFQPAINNLRKNSLVVKVEGPGFFYTPSIIAWKQKSES